MNNTITMTYEELLDIIKKYGKTKGHVWFFNSATRQKVLVERDTTRRYYMSCINDNIMHRVDADTFKSNVEWLMAHEFYICF